MTGIPQERIAALLDGVTDGPWRVRANKRDNESECDLSICGDIFVLADLNGPQYAHQHANARFIAAARDLVPALADRVAELEARALLDGIAMTETAMARDRAMTNLEHWRQEVGKLHSKIAELEANPQGVLERESATHFRHDVRVENWNTRADAPEVLALVEALRDAIESIDAAYDGPDDEGKYTVRHRATLAAWEARR